VATKLVRPTKTNQDVTEAWEAIAAAYGVNMVEGTLGHQMKRFVIDGNKVIIGKRDKQMQVDPIDFEPNEVSRALKSGSCRLTQFMPGDAKPQS
jgi:methionine aminopeptidase